jgi:hypothetical protein
MLKTLLTKDLACHLGLAEDAVTTSDMRMISKPLMVAYAVLML